ncbi:M28 family peptidase [Clostridium fermenticellae]|uniref:M28 family peptidase n=1 Tax=Clostridium fermenticellae TaxID=2068654 RepID=A0A386H6V3_9CLOT|nr:M28 family metallopeptidase [Clostridium fermenticellae]AYD41263.1 M28 family peptidase [Clostridium fermenticellae]
MKKNLILFSTVLSLLILNLSLSLCLSVHQFNSGSVKQNINYLSSDNFKGRLGGTLENAEVSLYIRDYFKKNNIMPYSGSYFEAFNTMYPHRLDGNPYLRVTDSNGFIVKNYRYSIDFKEDLINFRCNRINFSKKNASSILGSYLNVFNGDDHFLFYTPEDNKLTFRSSFVSNTAVSMYIMVTKNTLIDMRKYLNNGFNIDCYIPFESKQTSLNNVIGTIRGIHPNKPPLILCAHFDHVGSDLSNNIYNGALDNASGISFMLELGKYITSLGTPDRNIILVGFNAEEFGCLGSKAFVLKNLNNIKDSTVFNFDMIGGNFSKPIYIMGGKKDSNKTRLIHEISSICQKYNINFSYLFEDSSDHEFFRKNNISAVTLSDSDASRIHTLYDKSNLIDIKSIDRCFKVMNPEIIHYAFPNNIMLVYYKQILCVSILTSIIFLKLLFKSN